MIPHFLFSAHTELPQLVRILESSVHSHDSQQPSLQSITLSTSIHTCSNPLLLHVSMHNMAVAKIQALLIMSNMQFLRTWTRGALTNLAMAIHLDTVIEPPLSSTNLVLDDAKRFTFHAHKI